MYKSKITKKGQITIPKAVREKLELYSGAVVRLKLENDKILVDKPKRDLMSLYGSWKDMPKETFNSIKDDWKKSRLNH